MIAADTSVIIDHLQGITSAHTESLAKHLALNQVWIAPVVETELLSDPRPNRSLDSFLQDALYLEVYEGYWERAGKNRAKLKIRKLKAKVGDALIAQSSIDHDIPLLTRDPDFRHYAEHCGLKLAIH